MEDELAGADGLEEAARQLAAEGAAHSNFRTSPAVCLLDKVATESVHGPCQGDLLLVTLDES